jgi:glycosyltransferase involved in cell wall biosynthesis
MAVKLILTQIMKNESHIAERMLNSILPIVDGVVVVDTGSTDNSIQIVKDWGIKNNIETYVFEMPFDNFCNTRNHSFEKAREMFLSKNDGHTYYNFWLDFDEQMIVDKTFNKQKLDRDLYMLNTNIGQMRYTRNELCRLDKAFSWYGVVHEFIISKEKNITSGIVEGLSVNVQMDGGSWKGDIAAKYKGHAHTLEKYIDQDRKDPRWIFYTAQSYHDSSCVKDNREENEDRLRRSIRYYKERVSRPDGYPEEIFYSQYRIGTIMRALEEPWNLVHTELLKAYSIDPMRGEPIKSIIDYYLQLGDWNMAYMYSSFAVKVFHNNSPYPKRLLFVDESLYIWKFLEAHSAACFYTNRKSEAKQTYQDMVKISKEKPEYFSQQDLDKIQQNSQFFLN